MPDKSKYTPPAIQEESPERIAACLRYCKGISTPELLAQIEARERERVAEQRAAVEMQAEGRR